MFPLKDTVPTQSFPVINWILIALNVLMFLGELIGEADSTSQSIVYNYGVIPARFLYYHDSREFMTLFTSMFLHGGWLHLFSNMLSLYIFGDNIEDRLGPARYLVFYLLCGVIAELTHVYFNQHSTMPSLGASGAIAGVLGAYLLLFPRARIVMLIPISFIPMVFEIPAIFYLGFWFVTQLFSGTLQVVRDVYSPAPREVGGIAVWAHAGGFLAGALLIWPFLPKDARGAHRPPRETASRYVDPYHLW
jgi:membrane associated rhomboid family serine protease